MIRVYQIEDDLERKMDGCGDPACSICGHYGTKPPGGTGPLKIREERDFIPMGEETKETTYKEPHKELTESDQQTKDELDDLLQSAKQNLDEYGSGKDGDSGEGTGNNEPQELSEVAEAVRKYLENHPDTTVEELATWSLLTVGQMQTALTELSGTQND